MWQEISKALNANAQYKFGVDERGVRERYNLLKTKFNVKMAKELGASGTAPEVTEYSRLITEVIDIEEASTASLEMGKKNKDPAVERKKAEDIRLKAMETLSETKKRKELEKDNEDEDDENMSVKPKRVRRNASETLSYLKSKNEDDIALRKEEMHLKMEQQQQQQQQHNDFLQFMQREQQHQQQQQAQTQQMMAALLQQQQQQNNIIMGMMNKFMPQ